MNHTEFKPHAFITIANTGGIEVMLNKSNDGVFYRFNHGQDNIENEEIFEAEIDFINDMAGFYHKGDTFYSLEEAVRITVYSEKEGA